MYSLNFIILRLLIFLFPAFLMKEAVEKEIAYSGLLNGFGKIKPCNIIFFCTTF